MTQFLTAWYWEETLLIDPDILKKTGVFSLISGELLTCIVGGYWLGGKLDQWLQTAPWLRSSLALLGLVYSVWRIYGFFKQSLKESEKES